MLFVFDMPLLPRNDPERGRMRVGRCGTPGGGLFMMILSIVGSIHRQSYKSNHTVLKDV